MGIRSEDAVKEDHYYCEKCRPDLHVELLKYAGAQLLLYTPPTVSPPHTGDLPNDLETVTHPPTPILPQLPQTGALVRIRRLTRNPRNAEIL